MAKRNKFEKEYAQEFEEENSMMQEVEEDEEEGTSEELVSEIEDFSFSQLKISSRDPLKAYMSEIASFPRLTKEEEIALGKAKDEGNAAAREQLINCNMRLVVALAKKKYDQICMLTSLHTSFEDMIQDGCNGLLTAVDRYDWRKNCKFSTKAVYWINQAINAGLSRNSRLIRIPDHKVDRMVIIKRAETELFKVLSRDPSVVEIEVYLNLKFDHAEIIDIQSLIRGSGTVSLNSPLGENDDDGEIGDVIPADMETPDEYADRLLLEETIGKVIKNLPEKERLVILYSFGLCGYEKKTLGDIAQELYEHGYTNRDGAPITKEGIRQIKEKTLKTIAPAFQGFQV